MDDKNTASFPVELPIMKRTELADQLGKKIAGVCPKTDKIIFLLDDGTMIGFQAVYHDHMLTSVLDVAIQTPAESNADWILLNAES